MFYFGILKLAAQDNRKISGTITDTAKTALSGVNVSIITTTDTLKTKTDEYGQFRFTKINTDKFSVKISYVGYIDQTASFTFADKEKHKQLDEFRLKMSSQMLKEVVIKAKIDPVKFMQDTVEYNAAAFRVEEGDNVADLMKQLPGMEVDDDYNVKTMGKEMFKLRVNGKDFFTNDIKSFIGKLPAGIVSKIQVIDDFGDEANFTGIKIGEPIKMLNIVTKPGMNKGKFGSASAGAGTNDQLGSNAGFNLWNADKQSSANMSANTSNNGAGESRSLNLGLSHNNTFGKNKRAGFNYNISNNSSAFSREQIIESMVDGTNFINDSNSEGENSGISQNLGWNMNFNNKKLFIQTSASAGYNNSDNHNMSLNKQSGAFIQDLKNSNSSKSSSPQLRGNISLSKRLKNKNSSLSANASFSISSRSNDQNIHTNTLFYNKETGALQKDSLLNRDINSENSNQNVNFGFNYSKGLKKLLKDSLTHRSFNFSYSGSASRIENEASTYVYDNITDKVSFVDSLSTSFRTISFNQRLAITYNHNNSKLRYNFGFNANPGLLSNNDLRLRTNTDNNTFNYSPNANFSKTLSKGKTVSISYRGSNTNPTIQQLQPIRNAQSLQNIIVGNPELKPSFSHNMSSNFNYAHLKSGTSAQVGISGSTTQRQIVDHIILLQDTLDSQKQITKYENIDGNYELNGNYHINVPLSKNKHYINYSGSVGFSNRAIIFNNQKAFGKGLNFSQRISSSHNFKKFNISSNVSYSVTNNNDAGAMLRMDNIQVIGQISAPQFFTTTTLSGSINGALRLKKVTVNGNISYSNTHTDATTKVSAREVGNLNASLSSRITIFKSYFLNISGSKRANYGYALANSNPLIINANTGKNFLKNKALSVFINANDILGEGDNISRNIMGNTIVDSRTKQQTRVFSVNLSYNLSSFGGRHFRVDPD